MFKRNFTILFISILAMTMVVSGCLKKQNRLSAIPSNNNKRIATSTEITEKNIIEDDRATTTEDIDMSDWKVYRNEEYGFEVKYPESWLIYQDINTNNGAPLVIKDDKFQSCFFNVWILDKKIGKPLNEEFFKKDSLKINNFLLADKLIYNVVEDSPITKFEYIEFKKDKYFYTIKFPISRCLNNPEKMFSLTK